MALKFKCQNCDEDIIVKFLKVGETAKCKSCGSENVVPETVVEVEDEADYSKDEAVSKKETEASTSQMRRISPEEMRRQILEYEQKKAEKAQQKQIEDEFLAKRRFPAVIVALLVINVLLLILMEATGGSTKIPILYRFGGQLNSAVAEGEYWRLFSSMFLHIGILHLLFNCLALFFFGRIVELMYGRAKFLAIYLISGYFGNILFLAIGSPVIVSAGASGAIFGIIGAHIPLSHRLEESKLFADRKRAVAGIGYVIWIFFRSMGAGVNILAHLGGLIAGVVLGFVLCPEYLSAKTTDELQRTHTEEERPKRIMQSRDPLVKSAIIGAALIVLTMMSVVLGNRATPYGKLLQFNGGQLFYTSSVTEGEATKLGEYLVEQGFFDGNPKTAQLNRSGNTYQFRMVVKEGFEKNEAYIFVCQLMILGLSPMFDFNPVEVHLCDDNLKTIKIVKPFTDRVMEYKPQTSSPPQEVEQSATSSEEPVAILQGHTQSIHHLVKAGDKSKEMYANEQAIEYYNQALELMDEIQGTDPFMRAHIYLCLAEIHQILENREEALDFAHKVLGSSSDKKQRAKSYRIMGMVIDGQKAKIEHYNLAIAELGGDTELPEMSWISFCLFWPTLYSGHTEEAIEIAQRGLEIGSKTGNHSAVASLYICFTWVHMEPSYGINEIDKGFEYAQKSLEAAQKAGDLYSISLSTFWLGWAHMRKGEDDVAIKLMKEAIETYKKTGHKFHLRQACNWLSGIYLRRGDLVKYISIREMGHSDN